MSNIDTTPFIDSFTGEIKFYGTPITCSNVVYCGVLPNDIDTLANNNNTYLIKLKNNNYPDNITISRAVYNWINKYLNNYNGNNKQEYHGVPIPYTKIKNNDKITYRINQPTLFALVRTAYVAKSNNAHAVYINRNLKRVMEAKNNRYDKAMNILDRLLNMDTDKLLILNDKLTNKLYFAK